MPREKLFGTDNEFDVAIGWSDDSVQLGVVTSHDKPLSEVLENLENYTGLWSSVDRDTINRTIRLLRKARDRAYGADA